MDAPRICLNCGRNIPATSKHCAFCEAAVDDDMNSEEMREAAAEILAGMPADAQHALLDAIGSSDSADELIRTIFVGPCPKCESDNTGDCENDPEIDNPLVGRCLDCGYHWCTFCDRPLDPAKPDCPCWQEEPTENPPWLDA